MLLEFHQLPALAIGGLLVFLYAFSQAGALKNNIGSECDQARPRMYDVFTLLLMYFLIMFLRTLTIERMMFHYDMGRDELTSTIIFGSTILVTFMICKMTRAGHLFPDRGTFPSCIERDIINMHACIDPPLYRLPYLGPTAACTPKPSLTLKIWYGMLASVIGILFLIEGAFHVIEQPVQHHLQDYLTWFFGPRLLVVALWILVSFLLPVNGVKRFAVRGYSLAFCVALWFARPSLFSIIVLGVFLGCLLYEISVFGAHPIVDAFIKVRSPFDQKIIHVYKCPYPTPSPSV